MRGKKLMSSISYNSKDYLVSKLNELVKSHKIAFWIAIYHIAESDQDGKNHYHIIIEPNKAIDSMDIQDFLKEYDPTHPTKPLGCLRFDSSNYDDWILYTLHDKNYLAWKRQSREYHYTKEDFLTSDEMSLDVLYRHAYKASKFAEHLVLMQQLKEFNDNPSTLIDNGTVPLNLAGALNAYKYMQQHYIPIDGVDRNGRKWVTDSEITRETNIEDKTDSTKENDTNAGNIV